MTACVVQPIDHCEEMSGKVVLSDGQVSPVEKRRSEMKRRVLLLIHMLILIPQQRWSRCVLACAVSRFVLHCVCGTLGHVAD